MGDLKVVGKDEDTVSWKLVDVGGSYRYLGKAKGDIPEHNLVLREVMMLNITVAPVPVDKEGKTMRLAPIPTALGVMPNIPPFSRDSTVSIPLDKIVAITTVNDEFVTELRAGMLGNGGL